jgi:uncharacterized protein YegP (UPF0339 family)
MRFEVYDDDAGKPRWRLKADNGQTVASGGESFSDTSATKTAAENFKSKAKSWDYEVYSDSGGKPRWRAKSANGQTVATSGEAFESESNARRAADNVRDNAGIATGP